MTDATREYEMNRLMKMRHLEISKIQLMETINTTRVITRVETVLVLFLVLVNLAVLGYWYQFTQYSLEKFLGYYLTIGTIINIVIVFAHNAWENKYVTRKAAATMNKIHLAKMDYSGKIKALELTATEN